MEKNENSRHSFLAIAQRRTDVLNKDILHPFVHRVFGTPLLLRVNDLEGYTGRDLYDLIAKRMRKLVPKSALRFLEGGEEEEEQQQQPSSNQDEYDGDTPKNGDAAQRARPRTDTRLRRRKTLSETEDAAAGPVPRYGFRLRVTSRDGRRCALSPWYELSIGCLIPDNDAPTIVACGDTVTVDWHFAVDIATAGFGLRVNQPDQPVPQSPFRVRSPATVNIKNHSSCNGDAKNKGRNGSISLEDCLDAFAQEEKIPDIYCSHCKDFRVQTKRMSLWRLPPVIIIHLKRFQFTQHMRRKLRDLVVFPLEGLDLSRIVAKDDSGSAGASRRHPGVPTTSATSEKRDGTDHNDDASFVNGDGDDTTTADDTTATGTEDDDSEAPKVDSGRAVMLYDLYAVVHHQGALSGGHYVASLKSEIDGQWRLYNDAQVYEIHSRTVVDSSAYILFYIRRDVKKARLQDFWDIRAREGEGLTEAEVEKLMKGRSDRCVIS